METEMITINPSNPDERILRKAADFLLSGELVGIPTETVYGLAANAYHPEAVMKIFSAKGRPQDNPLIVHISDWDMLLPLVGRISENARKLAKEFWPGPLTMILPKSDHVPAVVTAGLESVAVRMPAHPVTKKLIQIANVPLAAPSANTAGRPSPTKAAAVYSDLCGKIPLILDSGDCPIGLESSVVNLTASVPVLLRPGVISYEEIKKTIGTCNLDESLFHPVCAEQIVTSPGLKYKHYAPKASVYLLDGSPQQAAAYLRGKANENHVVMCFNGEESYFTCPTITYGRRNHPEEQARQLFTRLREIDLQGFSAAYILLPEMEGIGMAVVNRLLRAAAFHKINLTRSCSRDGCEQ